jgi:ArsR family transcriptional regulator
VDYVKESEFLKALGHPIRLQIVAGLADGKECNVNTMVGKLGIPQSTVSQHLGILKNKGVVTCRKKGVETCYYIADERIKEILKTIGK